MFQTKVVEKMKAHIAGSLTPFTKNRAVYEIMWCEAGQATDGNMAHVHCILDT
jgi:hypothetical protein